jgi:hypothetical protein
LITLLAVGLVLVFGVGGSAEQGAAAKPRLSVAAAGQFSVAGTGFRPGETVRVRVQAGDHDLEKRGVASADGKLGMRFRNVKLGSCQEYFVTASGNKGSRAFARNFPRACGANPGSSR